MDGHRLGRLSLRLDVIYCVVLGALVTLLAGTVSTMTALPRGFVVALGLAVLGWAALVEWMLGALELRRALRLVMVANCAAALGVALVSLRASDHVATVTVLAVAVDVALFAVSQSIALARLRGDGPVHVR